MAHKTPTDTYLARGDLIGLSLLAAASVAALLAVGPISQDQAYHAFADRRSWFGIPNTLDVLSNAPFLVTGLWGLRACSGPRALEPRGLARILFLGVLLTGAGSAYYHWEPSNSTLVWDRLPMTIVFTSVVALVLHDWVSPTWSRRATWPLIVSGMASVAWWHWRDDLRPYAFVQFFPVVGIVWVLLRSRAPHPSARWPLYLAFVAYGLAKLLEALDEFVFTRNSLFSGHTLKHLAAAAATACLIPWRARPRT